MAICGYCNHPDYHVQFPPLGVEPSLRCEDCPRCREKPDPRTNR